MLDIGNEMIEHIVEDRNVILGKMTRSKDEQVRDAAECLGASFGRAMRERLFQLVDDCVLYGHCPTNHIGVIIRAMANPRRIEWPRIPMQPMAMAPLIVFTSSISVRSPIQRCLALV
ncbi:MAG: hypothetical protein ABSF41_03230 [Pseudolabrys sp.]